MSPVAMCSTVSEEDRRLYLLDEMARLEEMRRRLVEIAKDHAAGYMKADEVAEAVSDLVAVYA